MTKVIRIGTRNSPLAIWQAEHVAGLLNASAFQTEIITIETEGDRMPDATISKNSSKGVFTGAIEEQLFAGTLDIAVHSAKDIPSETPEGLELIGFTLREDPNDVILSHHNDFKIMQGSPVIGTASTRSIAFLKHFHPNVKTVTIRGNLETRITKMKAGECDALLLSYAGVHRLEFDELIIEKIPTSYFVPPVGQGCIVIECHQKLDFAKKEAVAKYVNHPETEDCIRAERAFLKTIQGGGGIPAFGYAHLEGALITLKAGIISLDGKKVIKVKDSAPAKDAKELGKRVAFEVLKEGGKEILDQIKQTLDH